MKIFKTCISGIAMLMMGMCFVACSDDDDNKTPEKTAAELIEGTYTGYSSGDCNYFSGMIGQDESVAITANADGTVNLTYTTSTWGNTTLSNIAVATSATGYVLSGSGQYSMGMSGSTPKEYDCTVAGTISSDKALTSSLFYGSNQPLLIINELQNLKYV